jgi:twinkle protein
MASFVQHEACPKCGSSDAGSRYDNGDLYCFACAATIERGGKITETTTDTTSPTWAPLDGECVALPPRGLTKQTCETWQYQVGEIGGRPCHIANFRDARGKLVAQKLRTANKEFPTLGERKNKPLYGLWRFPSGGRYLTVTEGELDALSVSQAFDHKYPVVSLPDGAGSVEKVLSANYEWLDRCERIVLMFDMDDPGIEAAEKAAAILPPGKVSIAQLPEKDANEVLVKHGPGAIVKAFWNAINNPWKPDGIVSGDEFTFARVKTAAVKGLELPYPLLQTKMLGLRKGELTLLTAGSGIGKSTLARELAYHLHQMHNARIGNVFLEEGNTKTAQGYVAIHNNVPLGKLRFDPDLLTEDQWRVSLDAVVRERMWFYDHFGSLDGKNLLTKLRYMATVCKVDFIILDHISIVTSGIESSSEGERKDIDILMTRLRSLVEETGIGIIAIVHLKRTGKNFNEGGQVSLSDLRGSASLEQLSDNVLALERNQQDPENATKMLLRILKCRELGETGEADMLNYDRKTGRITLAASDQFPEDDVQPAETL